jgi:hypothetical protein
VANGALVGEDLIVVAAGGGLVAKKVNVLVGDAAGFLGLGLEMLEAVGLIPPGREDIKGDLAANGEATRVNDSVLGPLWLESGKGRAHVRPRWAKRSLRAATKASRTLAVLS